MTLSAYLRDRAAFEGEECLRNVAEHIYSISQEYNWYLTNIEPAIVTLQYWLESENTSPSAEYRRFARLAREILLIPASEASVERLFSHLGHVYNSANSAMLTENINARLVVKMKYIFGTRTIRRPANCKFPQVIDD